MLARAVYSLIFWLAQPLVGLRLLRRARRQPEYLQHLSERYAFYRRRPPCRDAIWLHAVSLGETRAAAPLIAALLAAHPEKKLLLTHMTPTGRAAGASYVERYPGRVVQAYLPYDLPGAARRFLRYFQPQIGIFMETEVWPNLLAAARRRRLPLALVNARLSARSLAGYRRFAPLTRPAFAAFDLVAAQTADDAARLASVGARQPQITGNLKFDVSPEAAQLAAGARWRAEIGARPVWLAASTRDGEEALILDALQRIRQPGLLPGALLILVPRHPQRFDAVAALAAARQLPLRRRSLDELPDAGTAVWLGDSMGEMASYYAAADVALIGGSLLPFGGQNLIEAAACGCPVLVGPHTFNFAQAAEDAVNAGAAQRLAGPGQLASVTAGLLAHPERRADMREKALAFAGAHQGASARTLELLSALLPRQTAR